MDVKTLDPRVRRLLWDREVELGKALRSRLQIWSQNPDLEVSDEEAMELAIEMRHRMVRLTELDLRDSEGRSTCPW